MKSRTLPLFLALAGLLSGSLMVIAQSSTASPSPAANPPRRRTLPKPTNLQVLSKDISGDKLLDIMHAWEGQLGVNCGYCHTLDAAATAQAGRRRYNFADDGKDEKKTARLMLTMTQELNQKYISQIPERPEAVSCGTCHRGHGHPEKFIPPPEHEEHGPPPPTQPK